MVRIADEVRSSLSAGRAVVALESAIVTHGMPYPENVETAVAATRGRSLEANRVLVSAKARLAAEVAVALAGLARGEGA